LKGFDLDLALEYLQTLRSFRDLDKPLLGSYRHLRKEKGQSLQKHLAAAFYPSYGYGFARSHCYRHAATLGSIFKIVTSYEGLIQRFRRINDPYINSSNLNPLTIIDDFHKEGKEEFVGYHINGKAIPRFYKGGRMPRSLSKNLGKVDLVTAFELSSNPYFALLAGDTFNEPDDLRRAAELFSYGSKTGIELPSEISGKVPDDLAENRAGLYSLSIGQHSLVVTPLQTAVMLSAIANGGKVLQPKIVMLKVGRTPDRSALDELNEGSEDYKNCFIEAGKNDSSSAGRSLIKKCTTVVKREIFMPDQVRRILLEGMNRVVQRSQQLAIGSMQTLYKQYPEAVRDFIDLKGQMVGKTSTGEAIENIDMDLEIGTNKYNHLWFGGISFDSDGDNPDTYVFKDKYGKPELVVVVYLRYGAYGKDTTPVAAQVIKKWRAIKSSQSPLKTTSKSFK
jgi:cell division protein FtsI/penicillin-binding protein 2